MIRKKLLDYQANKSTSTSPERTRADRTPVGRRGKPGRPRGQPSAPGEDPTSPGSPEVEDDEEEEEEVDPDIDEFASPRALSFTGLVKEEQVAGEVDTLRAELAQQVLEGLRGDAYLAAQDLEVERLMQEDGIDELIRVIKRLTFPLQSLEAKELFRAGQQNSGPLARQAGESVVSFVSRRRRWWRQVTELDLQISESMRAELLLESAGLN